ncbi:hypothetical protein CXQ85_000929 [Candidozyma haemuli]|uniref:Extradiol ring-cleavage dioxygenase class III enzyme subunit B domain-containing protein n=1 Tax=Candidozyma haemuli TaxID=45357 RepID=A0A2V1AK20_9ASCO|nr:hypothetical protein CXQ85_000929 [[Candida] haemuloni]PVH18647.1 hypothetical protein CXQ85_000929 [[Candida] haemuloni]
MIFVSLLITVTIAIYLKMVTNTENSNSAPLPYKPNPEPFPAYFVSHGGPTFMYKDAEFGNKKAYSALRNLGNTIKNKYKPDYIVVVSAHWQSSGSKAVEIAVPSKPPKSDKDENSLVYDFYNFPKHMYQEWFRSLNSAFLAEEIRHKLQENDFHASLTERGIDHGVWVPFKVAFSQYDTLNPPPEGVDPGLDLPDSRLIQVSLTGYEKDFDTHFKLGQVLNHFRSNLIWDPVEERYLKGLVVCSGMSVHNLRDIRNFLANQGKPLPYTKQFNDLLRETLVNGPDLLDNFNKIKSEKEKLLYSAHPTLEHFVPLVVASGVISESPKEPIIELFNDEQGSLGWGIYQFGKSV